jgi:hypothetical protein
VVFTILIIARLTIEIIIIVQIDITITQDTIIAITGHIEGQIHIEKIELHITTHEEVIIRQDEMLQVQEDLQELTIEITEVLVQKIQEAIILTREELQEAQEIQEAIIGLLEVQEALVMEIVAIIQEVKKQLVTQEV